MEEDSIYDELQYLLRKLDIGNKTGLVGLLNELNESPEKAVGWEIRDILRNLIGVMIRQEKEILALKEKKEIIGEILFGE
jgi:hypothetical protein